MTTLVVLALVAAAMASARADVGHAPIRRQSLAEVDELLAFTSAMRAQADEMIKRAQVMTTRSNGYWHHVANPLPADPEELLRDLKPMPITIRPRPIFPFVIHGYSPSTPKPWPSIQVITTPTSAFILPIESPADPTPQTQTTTDEPPLPPTE